MSTALDDGSKVLNLKCDVGLRNGIAGMYRDIGMGCGPMRTKQQNYGVAAALTYYLKACIHDLVQNMFNVSLCK